MEFALRNIEVFPFGVKRQIRADIFNGITCVFSMVYDIDLLTVRFESKGSRRLFMMYKEGKRQTKTVFKNEYGFDVGLILHNKHTDDPFNAIVFSGAKFYYNQSFQTDGFIQLYRNIEAEPLVTVRIQANSGSINGGTISSHFPTDYFYAVLSGICWFSQLPANEEKIYTPAFYKNLITATSNV